MSREFEVKQILAKREGLNRMVELRKMARAQDLRNRIVPNEEVAR